MDPITLARLWLVVKPIKRIRAARRAKKRRKQLTSEWIEEPISPLRDQPMPKQTLQGGLTYSALAVTAVSYVLDLLQIVPEGYDAATVAGVLVGLVLAAYGRFRRENRVA